MLGDKVAGVFCFLASRSHTRYLRPTEVPLQPEASRRCQLTAAEPSR